MENIQNNLISAGASVSSLLTWTAIHNCVDITHPVPVAVYGITSAFATGALIAVMPEFKGRAIITIVLGGIIGTGLTNCTIHYARQSKPPKQKVEWNRIVREENPKPEFPVYNSWRELAIATKGASFKARN